MNQAVSHIETSLFTKELTKVEKKPKLICDQVTKIRLMRAERIAFCYFVNDVLFTMR